MTTVVVAVPTYQRNTHLRELLPQLIEQIRRAHEIEGRVVVVDNDPDGRAFDVVQDYRAEHSESGNSGQTTMIDYVHETIPGVVAVRNRILHEATRDDVVLFIDDDERPSQDWLETMVNVWHETGAAGVVGRVMLSFEQQPDQFVTDGGFYRRTSLPTGTSVASGACNNLLLDMAQIRAENLWFDPGMGLSGGEDTLFTAELTGSGRQLVFCREGYVTDLVPASRMNHRWLLKRTFSHGNSAGIVHLRTTSQPSAMAKSYVAAGGAARVALGLVRSGYGAVTGTSHYARGLRGVARGAGMFTAGLGLSYQEYGRAARRFAKIR